MNARDNDPLHEPINAKLAEAVAGLTTNPAWFDPWTALGPESTEEARLAVYRAVRDSGLLPEEAGFYLVSWQIDAMTSLDAETSLGHLDERMKAIEEAHGLEEGEFWPPGKTPEEYEELRQQHQAAWDQMYAAKLDEFGEHEMARQYGGDLDGFLRRSEAGRTFFHGPGNPEDPDTPEWVYELAEVVAGNMTSTSGPGPLGFLYREEDGFWEVFIYPKPVELVGGAEDGEIVAPGFSLDLEELRAAFDQIVACSWQSLGYRGNDPPIGGTSSCPTEWAGDKRLLIYEQRIWSPYREDAEGNSVFFYGTKGMMAIGRAGVQVFGENNKLVNREELSGQDDAHQRDFLDAIKEGRRPNADIEIGHLSSSLCHLGNIVARVGRAIRFDPEEEQVVGDDEANALLHRKYREDHWAVPKSG